MARGKINAICCNVSSTGLPSLKIPVVVLMQASSLSRSVVVCVLSLP